MSEKRDIERGLDAMAYELCEDGPVSVPLSEAAYYEFTGTPTLDAEALAEQIDGYGFTLIDTLAEQRDGGAFYYRTYLLTDHYKKVGIRATRDSVSIYPKESELPDRWELTRIIHSLEAAFNSELTYCEDTNE